MIKIEGLNRALTHLTFNKGAEADLTFVYKVSELKEMITSFEKSELESKGKVTLPNGTAVVLINLSKDSFHGDIPDSQFKKIASLSGAAWGAFKDKKSININFGSLKLEDMKAALVGIGLSDYRFRDAYDKKPKLIKLNISHKKITPAQLKKVAAEASAHALGQNTARHLVNLPPGDLNPKTYTDFVKKIFKGHKKIKVDVWNESKLKKEKMGLHVAVGQGAVETSKLVIIKYRGASSKKVTALVGKGITLSLIHI